MSKLLILENMHINQKMMNSYVFTYHGSEVRAVHVSRQSPLADRGRASGQSTGISISHFGIYRMSKHLDKLYIRILERGCWLLPIKSDVISSWLPYSALSAYSVKQFLPFWACKTTKNIPQYISDGGKIWQVWVRLRGVYIYIYIYIHKTYLYIYI